MSAAPVVAIDGPSGVGKGTVARAVAKRLGWHFLDSGSLYRILALAADKAGIAGSDEAAVAALAPRIDIKFDLQNNDNERVIVDGEDLSARLRAETTGQLASVIAVHPKVRAALLQRQRAFRRAPGLVADGRDMGTVIFPDAPLKVFLTASAATRAERRHKQLISKGISANIADLRADLEARDERDRNRSVAPLKPASDAVLLDNSALTVDQSVAVVLGWWAQRGPFPQG